MPNNYILPLQLEPLDNLFFRDGRPFEATSRAASGLPMPQTLAGAIRTLLLERHDVDFGRLAAQTKKGKSFAEALAAVCPVAVPVAEVGLRGPYFTLSNEVLIQAPASLKLKKETKQLVRLDPLKAAPPGWQPQAPGMLPLWRHGREPVEAVNGFLKSSGLRRFLEGGIPEPADLVSKNEIYDFDDRTGIGIDEKSNTAKDSRIYGIRMLVLKREAGLYAEVRGSAECLAPLKDEPVLMRFGGEGRHVVVRKAPQCMDWPQIQPGPDEGRLVLMTTPAWFNGWKPPSLKPVAAAVGDYQTVSGWDLAKGGPKPNRFMVPTGSVYFLPSGAQIPDLLVNNEDAPLGWGCFLEGNWKYV